MGHLTFQNYTKLQQRLNQYVPGIFESETLREILRALVSDEEARLCSLMPLAPSSAGDVGRVWKKEEADAREILETLAHKGMVYVFAIRGEKKYALAPPVLGFFEFSLMRSDGKFDGRLLAELYHKYVNVEGGFLKQYGSVHPALTRTFVYEDMLGNVTSEVLSYERISAGIDSADCITTGTCYCRSKMEHLGKACDAPMDVCLTFNDAARYLSEYGIARKISKDEAHSIVRRCREEGLIQIGENKKSSLVVICNCCGCCCDLLFGYKHFGLTGIVSPSNYIAVIDKGACEGCGVCHKRCPANAIRLVKEEASVDTAVCLGCGVCARFCTTGACRLESRPEKIYVPEDLLEKMTLGAIYQGKVGNFLFSDQTNPIHQFLREFLNFLVKLKPVQRTLLSPPVRSRLLTAIRSSSQFKDI